MLRMLVSQCNIGPPAQLSASTFFCVQCVDTASGRQVAVKALIFGSLRSWKHVQLLEREAQVLAGLSHPGIPKHLGYFEGERGFFLVQELAEGRSLADMLEGGWRAEESEIERIAGDVLDILQYLGSLRPPVIHRDIKPENLVIEGGSTGGRVLLVDFGGVQTRVSDGRLSSTIMAVGTYGYVAPEQFSGAAQPATDMYGLGATLLYLLSGQLPSKFPVSRLRLDFSHVPMSPRLRLLLKGLLEPMVEERLSAQHAQRLLAGDAEALPVAAAQRKWGEVPHAVWPGKMKDSWIPLKAPEGSRVQVELRDGCLEIVMPRNGAVSWPMIILLYIGYGLLKSAKGSAFWPITFLNIGFVVWLYHRDNMVDAQTEYLTLTPFTWNLYRGVHRYRKHRHNKPERELVAEGTTRDMVVSVEEEPPTWLQEPAIYITYEGSVPSACTVFGDDLNHEEQKWLAGVIKSYIASCR